MPRAAPVLCRPLRTSHLYKLVLPTGRILYAGWDRSRYLPGETARLVVRGQHLGHYLGQVGLEVSVERALSPSGDAGDGSGADAWGAVTRVQAAPAADGERCEASFAFAPLPPPVCAEGHLIAAAFSTPRLSAGRAVDLRTSSTGLEGARLSITVERQTGPDQWQAVAELAGTLEGGSCALPWRPPEPAAATPGVESCAFEAGGLSPGLAVLVARAPHLDGAQLAFELEREVAPGTFVPCGQAVATVHDGEARARVPLEARSDG